MRQWLESACILLLILAMLSPVCPAADELSYELTFSTYVGGERWEHARDICTDNDGNIYVVGGTSSRDFPTTSNAYDRTFHEGGKEIGEAGLCDAFVMKSSPDGRRIGSTLLGGSDKDTQEASMERKHFEVRSAYNAALFRCDRPWAAVSITTEGDFPTLSEDNRVGLLQLVFADTAEPDRPDSFTSPHAAELLDFVEQVWDGLEVLLIHCEAGMSRSPGVAAALSRIYYGDDGPWGEYDFPNTLVCQRLVDEHIRRASNSEGSNNA